MDRNGRRGALGAVAGLLVCSMALLPSASCVSSAGKRVDQRWLVRELAESEAAVRSLHCAGRLATVEGDEFRDSYLTVPAGAPFDEAFHKGELEWALVEGATAGRQYVRKSLRCEHLAADPADLTGGYRLSGLYSRLEQEFAFDGQSGTSLAANGALLPIGTDPDNVPVANVARITAQSPVPEPGFGDLQGLTLWAAGDALSRCLQKGRARYVGSEATQDGRLLCRVDVASQRHEGLEIRLWVDASRGFAVVRRQHVYLDAPPGMEVYEETLSVDLKEWAPGVWFPREVIFGGSQPAEVGRLLVDSVQVNQELDGTLFTVQFPPGTQVTDEVRGVRYTVPHAASPSGPVPGQAAGLHGT
jgi:hypothetical protein